MNTALWVAQIILALMFLMAGLAKLLQPYEKVKEKMTFAEDFSPTIVKLIGLVEVLGAIGVVLPAVTHILPWLTPLAAAGLILTMLGAIATNLRLQSGFSHVATNLVLLALALFVVYGRFVALPLS